MRASHLILMRWGARPGVLRGAEVIGSAVAVNVIRIPTTVGRISTHIDPMLIKRLSHLLCDWFLQVCLILLQHLGCIDVFGVRRLDILSALEVRATPCFAPYSSGLLRLEALLDRDSGLGSREESRYDPLPSGILLRVRVSRLVCPIVFRGLESNMHLIAAVPGSPRVMLLLSVVALYGIILTQGLIVRALLLESAHDILLLLIAELLPALLVSGYD